MRITIDIDEAKYLDDAVEVRITMQKHAFDENQYSCLKHISRELFNSSYAGAANIVTHACCNGIYEILKKVGTK